MSTWWEDHPDLAGVARSGRHELEADAVAGEQDAEQLRRRRRTIVDVCFEWMGRGDLVTVGLGSHEYQGKLVAAVNDLVIVKTRSVEASINATTIRFARSDQIAQFTGTSGRRETSSFRAQVGRFEMDRQLVKVHADDGSVELTGRVTATTDDHVLVTDSQNRAWAIRWTHVASAVVARD